MSRPRFRPHVSRIFALRAGARAAGARILCGAILVLTCPGSALAQGDGLIGSRRASFDTVVAVQDQLFEDARWRTQIIVDTLTSAELATGLQATFRPVFWRVNGQWESLLDQASVRYDFAKGANWRIEAGRFPSPVGLGMTENRPSLNPGVLWCHRLYYAPLPSLGPGMAPQSLVSAVYPIGVLAAASTTRWDARLAVVDRAPVDLWRHATKPKARANAVAGVGFTPTQGLRVGAALAWGDTAAPTSDSTPSPYRLVNVEGEWAFGYTRLSGEWTRDRFATPTGDRDATGWTVQARQTLAPRWFAHSRVTAAQAPIVSAAGVAATGAFRSVDSTVGYLINAEMTLRVGHTAVRAWDRPVTDHQLGVSAVWSQRWW